MRYRVYREKKFQRSGESLLKFSDCHVNLKKRFAIVCINGSRQDDEKQKTYAAAFYDRLLSDSAAAY